MDAIEDEVRRLCKNRFKAGVAVTDLKGAFVAIRAECIARVDQGLRRAAIDLTGIDLPSNPSPPIAAKSLAKSTSDDELAKVHESRRKEPGSSAAGAKAKVAAPPRQPTPKRAPGRPRKKPVPETPPRAVNPRVTRPGIGGEIKRVRVGGVGNRQGAKAGKRPRARESRAPRHGDEPHYFSGSGGLARKSPESTSGSGRGRHYGRPPHAVRAPICVGTDLEVRWNLNGSPIWWPCQLESTDNAGFLCLLNYDEISGTDEEDSMPEEKRRVFFLPPKDSTRLLHDVQNNRKLQWRLPSDMQARSSPGARSSGSYICISDTSDSDPEDGDGDGEEGGRALAVPAFKTEDPEQEDSLMDNPLNSLDVANVDWNKIVEQNLVMP